jgi:hypothetical protein
MGLGGCDRLLYFCYNNMQRRLRCTFKRGRAEEEKEGGKKSYLRIQLYGVERPAVRWPSN